MSPKLFTIILLIHLAACSNNYYWKIYEPSYGHRIPSDAVQAGKDLNEDNIFIGQVSLWGHPGIHEATISPGKDVWFIYGGAKRATNFIQILCSNDTQKFIWLPATSKDLHLVGMDKEIVRGGMHQKHATYIGRVKHQGNIVIGKVYTHDINNMDMVFAFNNREYKVKSYEILAYDTYTWMRYVSGRTLV